MTASKFDLSEWQGIPGIFIAIEFLLKVRSGYADVCVQNSYSQNVGVRRPD